MGNWVKIHRKIWENPAVAKDSDHLAVWVWLLTHAVFKPVKVDFAGKIIMLKAGQLTAGRQIIAKDCQINSSKVERILKLFKIEQQIEQQTSNKCRLITIKNWNQYQQSEQQIEQQVNNKRTTSEQQVNTKEECKELKNDKNVKNNISTNVDTAKTEYGNPEINQILEFLKKTFGLSDFKESQRWQRQYGKHLTSLVKKHGKDKFREALTNIANDSFRAKNCNSLRYLYEQLKSYPYDKPLIEPMSSNKLAGVTIIR